jgi:FtsH-binding integral membrane protein
MQVTAVNLIIFHFFAALTINGLKQQNVYRCQAPWRIAIIFENLCSMLFRSSQMRPST